MALVQSDNPGEILWELPESVFDEGVKRRVFGRNRVDGCTLKIDETGFIQLVRNNVAIWTPIPFYGK